MAHATTPPLPDRIGPYPLQQVIGAGSMGRVYLGHDVMINRPVAIKTIQHQAGDDAAARAQAAARFRIEAQSAGQLNHPGIVSIYQFGEDAGCHYIVMEYVSGESLREHLRRGPPLSLPDIACLMVQLLDALQAAHDHGVFHRDIKPANLIVTPQGRLKVTDFGIARMDAAPMTHDATRAALVLGTPGYMAPEQYTGGVIDGRTDLFAAGVLLHQLLCGAPPFVGTEEAVMYQIIYGPTPPLPADAASGGLPGLDALLARALAKRPADRCASVREFRDALVALMPWPVPTTLSRVPVQPQAFTPGVAPAAQPSSLPAHPQPPTQPSAASLPLPTGWNETALAGLERELAHHLGPVARVLVRRAARQHRPRHASHSELPRGRRGDHGPAAAATLPERRHPRPQHDHARRNPDRRHPWRHHRTADTHHRPGAVGRAPADAGPGARGRRAGAPARAADQGAGPARQPRGDDPRRAGAGHAGPVRCRTGPQPARSAPLGGAAVSR